MLISFILESDDVLHLCVSSKHAQVYELACKLVEDLLRGLYNEYQTFCQRMGRPLETPIQIKRIESNDEMSENSRVTSRKDSIDEDFDQV